MTDEYDEYGPDDITGVLAAAAVPTVITLTLPRDEAERWASNVLVLAESGRAGSRLAVRASMGDPVAVADLVRHLTAVQERADRLLVDMMLCGIEAKPDGAPVVVLGAK